MVASLLHVFDWPLASTSAAFVFCHVLLLLVLLFLRTLTLLSISFQIHWFSIFNSFMMVIFLVGLVSMILMRTLRKDYARYSKDDELDDMVRKF